MTAAAVLFDLDGLLIDSEPVWYDVESAAVAELGGQWGHEHQAACIGGTLDASCRYMLDLTGSPISVEQLSDRLLTEMVRRFRAALPVHDGALPLVDAVRAAGVATGLVSSSYRVLMDAALDVLGSARFDVSVAGDEIERGKPDPMPYLVACQRLGVAPAQCVVLEDAANGVASAEAAGCVVVAIPSIAAMAAAPGRYLVRALTDVDVGWLLDLPCS
ncbi:MAG TPA: HAD family phosphatase [Mycobacteriales bacterium]|nr:HAD family phosphatase [Mycobacteriales bacterium]